MFFFSIKIDNESEDLTFGSFPIGLFNILVLQTTANFPDVMLPFYKRNRRLSFIFVIFLIVNNMILINIMLSVFYINYKRALEKNVSSQAVMPDSLMKDIEYRNSLVIR